MSNGSRSANNEPVCQNGCRVSISGSNNLYVFRVSVANNMSLYAKWLLSRGGRTHLTFVNY